MLEKNRIIKQEEEMDKFKIAGIHALREQDLYVSEIFEIITRLYEEHPNCFDKDVINHKMSLTYKLLKKYHLETNNYYHYTLRDNKNVIGVRYKCIDDDVCDTMFSCLKNKVILQVVKYEIDQGYLSELKSLVSYNGLVNEVNIINIAFSETLADEKYMYYWTSNNKKEANKVFTKKIGN